MNDIKTQCIKVSLIIPIFNEAVTLPDLIEGINNQAYPPDEVILVDTGSTDNSVQIINNAIHNNRAIHLINAGRAMPGEARNIGTKKARNEWIAYTDAGILLDSKWLEKLITKIVNSPGVAIVYGSFNPIINSFFTKCATLCYVPALKPGEIRAKSIASCLLQKRVWNDIGGFTSWRASEDLIFIEKIENNGYHVEYAPNAIVFWQLRSTIKATFQKFITYSMHNVWAGRQAYWHYGVARQYVFLILSVLIGLHVTNWSLILLPLWVFIRAEKRILQHCYEFGRKNMINPLIIMGVIILLLIIETATIIGWIKALIYKNAKY